MFDWLGKVVCRSWHVILILWLSALLIGWTFAPAWETVTKSGEVAFLPSTAPSRRAETLFEKAFPLDYSAGVVAIVYVREAAELDEEDFTFLRKKIVPFLGDLAAEDKSPIATIRTFAQEGIGSLLVSEDKKATVVVAEVSTPFQDSRNVNLVARIERHLHELEAEHAVPEGRRIGLTGSAVAGRDLDLAEASSARTIERWTIGIVIGILVLLYRAPLVAIIPLFSVFVSVEISVRLLGFLAGNTSFSPSRDLRVFVTVLAYGAGVDYCLFLIARYREELANGLESDASICQALSRVGQAITASAATSICGIGMLAFASFGKIHEAGLVIPLALSVALLSTLTFTGSLLRWIGPKAFWPQRVAVDDSANIYDRLAPGLMRRPGLIFLATTMLLVPFALVGVLHYDEQNFNPLGDLPQSAPSRVGSAMLERHFPAGMLGPVTMLIESPTLDFRDPKSDEAIAELTRRLYADSEKLGIADVRSLTQPLGFSDAAVAKAEMIRKKQLAEDIRKDALQYYVSEAKDVAGRVVRLDITLAADPLNRSGIASLERIQNALPELLPSSLQDAQVEFSGSTASLQDLSAIKRGDQDLIQVLVSSIVFVLLLIVLRRVVLSIFLVASVLLSYLATLGLTDLVFHYLEGADYTGLDWKVPIFLFTILVAVGVDYNIFLLTRIKEERDNFGPKDAIPHALARTGKVISSCGFVMAGTFASLLSGSLLAMKQLGFALSVGVLIDTLVVRPILVPTFLAMLQNLFPGKVGRYMALGRWGREETETSPNDSVASTG